jgi:hypothetical protein
MTEAYGMTKHIHIHNQRYPINQLLGQLSNFMPNTIIVDKRLTA